MSPYLEGVLNGLALAFVMVLVAGRLSKRGVAWPMLLLWAAMWANLGVLPVRLLTRLLLG